MKGGVSVARLNPEKLHVRFLPGVSPAGPIMPRRYTLTHSDRTAHLYLTIGPDYHEKQLSGILMKFMRDEVLGEWVENEGVLEIHIYCHVSGGFVYGSAYKRNQILRKELPLALEAIRIGDDFLCSLHPELNQAPVIVHFQSDKSKYNTIESWNKFGDYAISRVIGK